MVHVPEKVEYIKYRGMPFPKKHFRTTVYGANKAKKVANSWEEYQDLVATGLWFDDKKKVEQIMAAQKKEEDKELTEDKKDSKKGK